MGRKSVAWKTKCLGVVWFVRPRRSCAYVIIANKFHYIPWIDYIIIAWAGLTRVE